MTTRVSSFERWKVLRRSTTFWVGLSVTLMWVVFAVFGDFVTPHDPAGTATSVLNRLEPPSSEHWFGTDSLGRDVLSRLLVGSRQVLIIAPAATLLGTVVGTILGLVSGYFGGIVDEVMTRILDTLLSLPVVVTAVLALAALGPNTLGVVLVIGFVFAPIIAKTVRATVLAERGLDYVTAAQLRREGSLHIMFVEILPNVMGPIIVEFTVRLGYAIFATLTLGFLGFGIDPSIPDWGQAINEHYVFLTNDIWWPTLWPALAIASLVVAVNLLTDGISQAFET